LNKHAAAYRRIFALGRKRDIFSLCVLFLNGLRELFGGNRGAALFA